MVFRNWIEVSLTGKNIERFLNLCSYHGIVLHDIYLTENSCRLKMNAKDFFGMQPMVKKSKIKIKILHKQGIVFWLKKQTKRKLFLITPFLGLLLLWLASHFLWRIEIHGNYTVTNDLIKDFLQSEGIYYGMPLKEIPMKKLEFDIRKQHDEITWVSIYLKGTSLQIYLKENDDLMIKKEPSAQRQDLIAPADGIVESALLRQGTLMTAQGESVKKGDVLILGKVEIPAEDGSVKETRYCKADGDIYLICNYPVSEALSMTYTSKRYSGREKHKLAIYTRRKSLVLPFMEIPYTNYDVITRDVDSVLCSLLSLPLEIKEITYRDYYLYEKKYSVNEAQSILNDKLNKIIESLEQKGVQIIEKNVKINTNSAYAYLTGNLTVKLQCKEYKAMEEYP